MYCPSFQMVGSGSRVTKLVTFVDLVCNFLRPRKLEVDLETSQNGHFVGLALEGLR